MSQGRSLQGFSFILACGEPCGPPNLSGFHHFLLFMLVCSLMPSIIGPAVVSLGSTCLLLASPAGWIVFLFVREWQPQKRGTVIVS